MHQSCRQCQQSFEITPDDLAFYDKVSPVFNGKKELIPPPTRCPECRWQRRLLFRNEYVLYKRSCSLTGKSMVSMFPQDAPFPVYEISAWQSDRWNPLEYGRAFDPSQPFFQQLTALLAVIPHYNLFTETTENINSEYTNCAGWNKNCFLIVQSGRNEDCYYGRSVNQCKNCCDCLGALLSERCYECVDIVRCYECVHVQQCDQCSQCELSTDLRSCQSCIGCHGLAHREYCFLNESISREEWQEYANRLRSDPIYWQEVHAKSEALRRILPKRAVYQTLCEDVVGDHNLECRSCFQVFDSYGVEHAKYCYEITDGSTHDCYDFSMWGQNSELLYEVNAGGTGAYHLAFCDSVWQSVRDLYYCLSCFPHVHDCFGCFGLRHKQYCILNKQYTQEEYEDLVPKIIEKMRATPLRMPDGSYAGQEWGEFFPMTMSPFAYNETIAQDHFPLTKEDVLARGWRWRDQTDDIPKVDRILPAAQLPDSIDDIPDDILNWAIECEATKRPFKIIKQELEFYRQMRLPIPHFHPDERHRRRMALRNPRKLWKRECMKCGKDIETSYAPDRPEIVYCESCYLASVY